MKDDFEEAIAEFRNLIVREGERSEIPNVHAILLREHPRRIRWALPALTLGLIAAIPIYRSVQAQREAEQAKADELLREEVNAGLSRTVARSMDPLMKLVSWGPNPQSNRNNQGEDR